MDSNYKDKIEKVKSIGLKLENNLNIVQAKNELLNILNSTIFKSKPISLEELNIDLVEKLLRKIDKKYKLRIGYILPVIDTKDRTNYSFSLRIRSAHLDTIFARTLFEGCAKSLIVLYYYSRVEVE